ncbi:EAL domain-containing protein [Thiomicrorhabdus sp. Milos-T2]|uniref:EAL domain-containing protein n=1 Tax=Thiomicrorhabdus sp. Milos-T2 TaxID=90814 RepID=UPI00131A13E8|nr:EAL domain-containing protein [Thiomicrorhabdus sp. Milos-T2]
MNKQLKSLLLLLSWLSLICASSANANQTLTLGVYQYQSKESVTNQYTPLAKYLSDALPGYNVALKVYTSEEIIKAVHRKEVDLLFVNPNLYEVVRQEVLLNGVTATQQKIYNGQALASLGGVIFSQKQSGINTLQDLVGKTVAIPTFNNTGAYRVPLYEVYKAGINYKKIKFTEVQNNDSVVQAVLSGKAQAGFVRTGILESWLKNHHLAIDDLHIINQQKNRAFPQLLSTRLVPEWPFLILPGLDDNLKRDIVVALFSLRENDPAAKKAGIAGFVAPLDYKPIEEIVRELKLPPYDIPETITTTELWHQYKWAILCIMFALIILLSFWLRSEKQRKTIFDQEQSLLHQAKIDELLLKLPKFAETHSEAEVMQYAMENIETLTHSPISFIHLFDAKKEQIELVIWSHETLKNYCHVENYEPHYPLQSAGVWADAARQKKVVVINDYNNYPHKKGLPEGHATLSRMISIPVIDEGEVVLLAGIGNKASDYVKSDIDTCQLVCNELWRLMKSDRYLKSIRQHQTQYARLLNDLGKDYFVFSHNGLEGVLLFVSEGVQEIMEFKPDEVLNRPWFEKVEWDKDSIEIGLQSISAIVNKDVTENDVNLSFITPSGKHKTLYIQHHGVFEGGKLISIDGLVTDITDKIASQNNLKQADTVFTSANEGILICDKNNHILRANQRVFDITGYSQEELIGFNPRIFSSGHQDHAFYKKMWHALLKNGLWEGEIWNRRKNGELYPQSIKISTVCSENQEPQYFIALFSDITYQKEHELQLEKMAHYDALTKLPNRFLLSDRITQAISRVQRSSEMLAVMFIDLDGFKQVNDHYGHQAGDFLLQTLAARFSDTVREKDTVSRIGGDEFIVLVTDIKHLQEFAKIEARLLKDAAEPVIYEDHSLAISCSIGVVYYQNQYAQEIGSEQLIRYADQTMYQAKNQGKNRIQHYPWNNLKGKNTLLTALQNNEFVLYFQPKVDCKKGKIRSLEALLRWNHPTKGLLAPIEFLKQINQYDLMDEFTEYVLEQSVKALRFFNDAGYDIGISLNINGTFLLNPKFNHQLVHLFEQDPDLKPKKLTLEILESSALSEVQRISSQIKTLQTKGFKFSIDDFGTGHASLNYLKNLPVDEVKIDQEFIKEIFTETNSLSIIEAIKSMAEAFNLRVVAEGAETKAHVQLLLQLGINTIQGYALAKPMTRTDTLAWLKNPNIDATWQDLSEVTPIKKHILKAQLAHLAWVNSIENIILHDAPIEDKKTLSSSHCEFGHWLKAQGHEIFTRKETFSEIDLLHQQLHELANQAIECKLVNDLQSANKALTVLKEDSQTFTHLLQKSLPNQNLPGLVDLFKA